MSDLVLCSCGNYLVDAGTDCEHANEVQECDLARGSNFPCSGGMREDYQGDVLTRVCAGHRARILEDIRSEESDKHRNDEAADIWSRR